MRPGKTHHDGEGRVAVIVSEVATGLVADEAVPRVFVVVLVHEGTTPLLIALVLIAVQFSQAPGLEIVLVVVVYVDPALVFTIAGATPGAFWSPSNA